MRKPALFAITHFIPVPANRVQDLVYASRLLALFRSYSLSHSLEASNSGTGGPSDLNYFPIPLETSVTIGSTTPSPGFAPQDIRKGRQSQCTIQKPLHYGTTATYMRLLSITLLIFSVASPGLKVVFHPECVKDDFANFRIRRWVIRSACVQQAIAEREVNQNVNGSIQDGAAT